MKNTKRTTTRTNHLLGGAVRTNNWVGVVGGVLLGLVLLVTAPLAQAAIANRGTVVLAWDSSNSSDVAGYRVYFGTTSGNYTSSVQAGSATTTTIQNLTSGATYYFAVKAYNSGGLESAFSNEISFVPGATTLQLTITATGQAVLTVNGQAGHTYEVQAARNLNTWSVLGNVTVGTSGSATFTDTTAGAALRRFYRTRDLQP